MDHGDWTHHWAQHVKDEVKRGTVWESSEDNLISSREANTRRSGKTPLPLPTEPVPVTSYKKSWHKAQCIGLLIGLLALVLSPLISNTYYRVAVQGLVLTLLIRLFIVALDDVNKKIKTMFRMLSALDPNAHKHALKLENFAECQPLIKEECQQILKTGQDLEIDSHVVAACFSWPFFHDLIPDLCRLHPQSKITFRMGLVAPTYLSEKGADNWAQRVEATLADVCGFMTTSSYPNLKMQVYLYDRIPESHGILIRNTLWRGRTEWVHRKDGTSELRIGSRPYTRYTVGDGEGNEEISTFCGWMNRDRSRITEVELNDPLEQKTNTRRKSARGNRRASMQPSFGQTGVQS